MADQEQGNIRQEFNLARVGLNLDSSINQVEKGKLTYALNASVENFDSNSVNYQNEPGNELCLNFPEDFHLIGEHFIQEQNKHIFFLVNPNTGSSEIGYMDNNDCIYHMYINASCLNFNINNPIHKAVHKITNCTTEIYWTDGLNPRRYLDLNPDNIPYKLAQSTTDLCNTKTTSELDCNQLNIQPNFEIPLLSIIDIVNVGELKAGTYQFAIQYSNASGIGYTSFYSITNPTPIFNQFNTTPTFDYTVGKSIVINITNLDITGYFQYYNLAVIKTINNISSVELVGTYNISTTSEEFTYSGQNEIQIALSLADVFEKYPYYEIAQDITTVQDILIWDGLTSIDRINYQKIANQINLQWQTYKIPATENYSTETNATNLRGYLRDEVYPFEIVFLLKNGKQTDGFHIPGRAISFNESTNPDVPSTNPDFIGTPDYTSGNVGFSAYWKIYNTGSVLGYDSDYTNSTDKVAYKGAYQYGDFAYWQSTDTYPCDPLVWGDLANQPIRHHKFPDVLVSPVFESAEQKFTVDGKYAVEMQAADAVFPIGVRLDVQQVTQLIYLSDLPKEQKDNIESFKIVRGDRTTNKSIVAKGIIRNVGLYNREGTDYYYPNYPYNDLTEDPFLLVDNNAYNATCNTYSVDVTVAGSITYTRCENNQNTTVDIEVGHHDICSIITPIMTDGTATIVKTSGDSYTITVYVYTPSPGTDFIYAEFEFTDPITLSKNSIKICAVDFCNYGPITISSTTAPVWLGGSIKYNITKNPSGNVNCYPANLDGFAITKVNDPRYRMVFNSPETSFGKPFLGNILKMESAIYGAGKAHFVQVTKHATYRLLSAQAQVDALNSSANIASIGGFDATAMFTAYQAYLQIYINGITRQNFAYSFNSVANYDYSASIENNLGIKQRQLDVYQYLIPGVQSVGDSHNVNNFERESSVYIKTLEKRNGETVEPLPFAQNTPSLISSTGSNLITDNSRFTLKSSGNCGIPEFQNPINVVSYYGSLKTTYPNQWGQIYSYVTIDTGFQTNIELNNIVNGQPSIVTVFGGDTFINKFAFKTKLPFFIDNRVGAPSDSDIYYDEIGNVAYPQYWYSARSILYNYTSQGKLLQNIISIKAHNFDCPYPSELVDPTNTTTTTAPPTTTIPPNGTVSSGSRDSYYSGKMYLFAYGIPNFYVESSINVDLRQAFNNKEGDFYPHVSTGIPDQWLQESNVSVAFDNTYYYNPTYSKQNTENYFSHLPADWTSAACYTNYPFRAIYSDTQESDPNNRVNNWLSYSPLAFFDFPQNFGDLISLDGIQNKAILARFENKSLLYNTMLTIQTSNPQAAYMGNSTLFRSSPPIDFAETDLGYVGTQNKMLLKIPQGQITVDAKRGQVFLIAGNQATDLSAFGSGLNRFFTDHLAFEILRYYPNADTDNHFNGIGLHGVYDSKYDRVIISKLDYIPQVGKANDIFYDASLQKFYVNRVLGETTLREYVELTNIEYFCNKSWTLSFNMNTKSWVSFHSYIPNWYIAENNFFYSGLNEGCDLTAIAIIEIPSPATTTTTTTILNCELAGTAVYLVDVCALDGTAVEQTITTTTTTTTSPSTTCFSYRIENNTGISISISWYDCSGVFQSNPTLGNGSQANFCADTAYGPIEAGGGTLFDLGDCVL